MTKKKDKALEAPETQEVPQDIELQEPLEVLEAPEETSPGIFLGSWPTDRQAGKHAASYREAHPGETADIKHELGAFDVYVSSYVKG